MSHPTRDTDQDWRLLAEREPYWSVLNVDAFRKDALTDDAKARFLQSGEEYMARLFGLVQRHLVPDFQPARALDLGCGVGRLLLPMAQRVEQAVGVDIAPAMLALSAANAHEAGITNAVFVEGDDSLSRVEGQFGLVNCYHVLQHVPPARGYGLIEALLARLAPGGVCALQITYAKARKFLEHEAPKSRYYRRDGLSLIDILPTAWQPEPGAVTMYDYDLNQVMAMLQEVAGQPMLALPTSDDSHLGTQFVFQRAG